MATVGRWDGGRITATYPEPPPLMDADRKLADLARLHTLLTNEPTELHPCTSNLGGDHFPIGWRGGAGPLDALWPCVVAEDGGRTAIPDYSTYAGLQLTVDAMRARGLVLIIHVDSSGYAARFKDAWQGETLSDEFDKESLPLAVMLAALSALEGQP